MTTSGASVTTVTQPTGRRPRVVIVGSGFGGLFAAKQLKKAPVDITLVAKTSHHLFQPLLYQVATGILSEGEIAPATREILRDQDNARVVLGEVTDIDLAARTVTSTTPFSGPDPTRSSPRSSSVRMVVAPSRRLQKAAKSCSPRRSGSAVAGRSRSSTPGTSCTKPRSSGSRPERSSASR